MDTLKAMMARAEASKDLSETDKKSVAGYLEAGIRLFKETDGLNAEVQKITKTVSAAPQRIKEIQAKLNVKDLLSHRPISKLRHPIRVHKGGR